MAVNDEGDHFKERNEDLKELEGLLSENTIAQTFASTDDTVTTTSSPLTGEFSASGTRAVQRSLILKTNSRLSKTKAETKCGD